ncbi:hypothetical protein GA0115237_10571, partial [Streptomyces sp. ScaeMP-6W]
MTSQTYRSAYTAREPGVRALPEDSRLRPPAVPRQAGPPGPACPAC